MDKAFRVIAIIAAFNEGDIISPVIGHLAENGIDVYLIDNHSTDDTREQASQWLGRGLLRIESFPPVCSESPGSFDWTSILHRKEELAGELPADWFIHNDADEIRESPWPGMTLKEAIRWVDTVGYNCIDFKCLNFSPVDDGFRQGDDPRIYFTFYENAAEFDKVRLNCWKKTKMGVSLASSGGHEALFENRRVFPIKFLLRHYPIRSQRHGVQKIFAERKSRFLESERSKGWHIQYNQFKDETQLLLRNPAELRHFDLDRARLELMLPDEILRNLADRLKNDEEIDSFRTQKEAFERGLEEYKQHVTNLTRVRATLEQKVANLDRELDERKQRTIDLQRRAGDLEILRRELHQRSRSLEQEIIGIRNSRSWRWSAPLRHLFDLVDGLRRRI